MTALPLQGRLLWYELLTTDMKAAEAFYGAVVGWTFAPFPGLPMPYDIVNRSGDVGVGGVMTIPDGMNFPPHWEMYVGVSDFDDAVRQIEAHGGSGLSPGMEIAGVGRLRTMKDPQGAVFAILQPSVPESRPEAAPVDGDIGWHELYTTDAPAAMKFYGEVFGWSEVDAYDMGPMGKYYMFGRTYPLGGMMTKTPDMAQVPTNWGLYFQVTDVNAAADRVKGNGGQVLNGPMEVPGGDWIVNALDPQGAAFSLVHKKR
jgi:predicted enzyme related to lactoylglutathione lyase